MVESGEIRRTYLEFFKERGHAVIPSASLLPQNDPTTLFTGSGMQSLLPYLLGEPHPAGKRIVNSQKCFRAMDIEEVGDNRHMTFFEMLGNWSLGDYFKKEQLTWFFEFLVKEVLIPKERLWVTCFEGDRAFTLPKDTESAEIWKGLGIAEEHILFYGTKKNWWSRAGEPKNMPEGEPGGPDSEVFYEFTGIEHNPKFGAECHPNCDCGRFMEIGNSVFMQYVKKEDGIFTLLPKQNVDFGGGLERITAAGNNDPDVFNIDIFASMMRILSDLSESSYADPTKVRSFRIVADHIRAAAFLIADGVHPSNTDQGYFVRRLIRRAVQHSDRLGVTKGTLAKLVESNEAALVIREEENKFRDTLTRGLKELEKGTDAFTLFSTYGFPFEFTKELLAEKGKQVDEEKFREEMKRHQDLSRAGAEKKFKGGLRDQSEAVVRLHTAHHLLLKALQMVLGSHVKQRGSNITGERLRVDFAHGEKMSADQIKEVERVVNEQIYAKLPVIRSALPRAEAEKLGAEMEFGQKYPDMVSVYSIGPLGATVDNPQFAKAFSVEFCGGPHVGNTSELSRAGHFKIQKEEASSAGVRRIKATVQ